MVKNAFHVQQAPKIAYDKHPGKSLDLDLMVLWIADAAIFSNV